MELRVRPPERRFHVRLSDGRKLLWHEWGPAAGAPVLFCTGAAMSGCLGFGEEAVEELGLRLMVVDRPGLGGSDRHAEKSLLSWAEDIRELLNTNGLHLPAVVGFSQGAPFALALAAAGLASAVAIVSGQDELAYPPLADKLHPDVARMVRAVGTGPDEFEEEFSRIATWNGLMQLILALSCERDRALYTSEGFKPAFERALREGFAQGPGGYVRDLVNAMGKWPFRVEEITVPVYLWYGRQDTSTVHSPDFGATLAQRLPKARLHVFEEEGGSLLWTRAREILVGLTSQIQKDGPA